MLRNTPGQPENVTNEASDSYANICLFVFLFGFVFSNLTKEISTFYFMTSIKVANDSWAGSSGIM